NVTQLRRHGHFSRCPEEYKHYCVKGRCRFLVAEKAPACVCERGYTGARCERVDIFYLRGDQGQIVVISSSRYLQAGPGGQHRLARW
ncbi:PREDICTED: probetacellulin-like, partial [Eurypyga helias]|uniref:probetacellulin-like n=1 Tax=Eurypyga helias TaxID=54383 RepID=UPI00052913FE